jgi:hypothetical protein
MAATGFWIGLVLGLTVAAVLLAWSLQLAKARARGRRGPPLDHTAAAKAFSRGITAFPACDSGIVSSVA